MNTTFDKNSIIWNSEKNIILYFAHLFNIWLRSWILIVILFISHGMWMLDTSTVHHGWNRVKTLRLGYENSLDLGLGGPSVVLRPDFEKHCIKL